MAIGDQGQQVASQGLGLDQIADVVNRQKISDKRLRNEMMRMGTSDPNAFSLQNKQSLQQAQQPSEFWGAGRQLAENQNIQDEGYGVLNSVSPVLGGQRYYYGNLDPTSKQGLASLYDNPQYRAFKQQQDALKNPAKNYSIAELKDLISPPKSYDAFSSFGDHEMPENQELTRQRNLLYELNDKSQGTLANIDPGWYLKSMDNPTYYSAQALYNKPLDDIFNAKVLGPYNPLAHQNDPTVKFLNSKYKLTPGGWDLGDGKRYVPTKSFQGNDWYGVRGKTGNEEMDAPTFSQFIEKDWADAFTPEGTFNKEGWHVVNPDYDAIARRGMIGTASVLAPAFFSYLGTAETAAGQGGTTAGSSATIPAGSEGLMTGSLATEAAPAVAGGGSSAGMFGNSNLNLGNSYLNALGEGAIRAGVTSGGDPKATLTGALGGMFGNMAGNTNTIAQKLSSAGFSPAAIQSILSGSGTALSGLLTGKSAQQSALSGIGSGLGSYANTAIQGLTSDYLGDAMSKVVGGAAGGGLNSLFNQNSPVQGSLFGAMSGGLHGFLNSSARDANTLTPEVNSSNKKTANDVTNLARLFTRNRNR